MFSKTSALPNLVITKELFHYARKLQNKKIYLKNANSNCQSSFCFSFFLKGPLGNWQFSFSLALMSIYRTELNCILCLKLNFEEENEAGKKSIRVENVGTSLKLSELESDFDTFNL